MAFRKCWAIATDCTDLNIFASGAARILAGSPQRRYRAFVRRDRPLRPALPLAATSLVLALGLLTSGPGRAQPAPLEAEATEVALPGPQPFVESHPLLAEVRALLTARTPQRRALVAALPVLEDWLAQRGRGVGPGSDPLARATGEWLRARLLSALGRDGARAAWEALATSPGAFSDDAREVLAELDQKARRPTAAAHWLLTRSPWSPRFLEGVRAALKDLGRVGANSRAIEPLEAALLQGMSPQTRTELVLLLSRLHREAGQDARALELLEQSFWHGDPPDKRVARELSQLDRAPDPSDELFRKALHGSRTDCQRLLKAAPRRADPKAALALALARRWDDGDAAAALATLLEPVGASVPAKERRGRRAPADLGPMPALTRGMLLRKLDRDDEAIESFLDAVREHPDHALTTFARDQASTLLRARGRNEEASALDQAQLQHALPGTLHRSALWRQGFGAILDGGSRDAKKRGQMAEVFLAELERRHGGEPDRHAFSWFERARYWRGRAAELAGERELAQDHWQALVSRFPAGWYALLARNRLGDRVGSAARAAAHDKKRAAPANAFDAMGWDVPRDDPMATSLALYRLGDETRALEELSALHGHGQLPGNGRKLLAELLELSGDERMAARVLKHAAIPPTMPGDDPDVLYFDWYPLRFEEALGTAAANNNLPSSLLAGLVSVETRFNADVKSHAGAIGAAQLLETTGTAVGRKVFGKGFDKRTLRDPDVNLAVAARYLSDLLNRFKGHPALAVAAYNAGPAPVKRWLEARGDLELDAFVETIPFEQARRYVMRVLSDAEIYRRLYGLDGHPISLPLSLEQARR